VTSALGELVGATQDTDLDDDINETEATLAAPFYGTIIARTDSVYDGGKLLSTSVWSDADNGGAAKHTTTRSYDGSRAAARPPLTRSPSDLRPRG